VGTATYQPRAAEGTVLHRVVRENLETFLREVADRTDGGGLPRFVEREFREFIGCGALSRGFARVRCEACAFERLVPFLQTTRLLSELWRAADGGVGRPPRHARRRSARRESPALAGISSASIQGRIALGPRAGARVIQIGREPDAPWVTSRGPCQAHLEGFDLHANITVGADDRAGVERLCRYILRPPVWRRIVFR